MAMAAIGDGDGIPLDVIFQASPEEQLRTEVMERPPFSLLNIGESPSPFTVIYLLSLTPFVGLMTC